MKKRYFAEFDMSAWEMSEDIECASSMPRADFLDNMTKLTESYAKGLEGKFQNTVREGVEMALAFFIRDPDYCGFSFSDEVNDKNPKGVPSIAFHFGDDYNNVEPFEYFAETCTDENLQKLAEIIADEKSKRIAEKERSKVK